MEGKIRFGKIQRVPPKVRSNVSKAAKKGAVAVKRQAFERASTAKPLTPRTRKQMRKT